VRWYIRAGKKFTATNILACSASSEDCACEISHTVTQKTTHHVAQKMKLHRQSLRAGCSKAEPKIIALPQTPFPGVRDSRNLISRRWSLPLPTDPVWRGSMHAISSYRGNRPTNTQINPHTGPITLHCATKLSSVHSVMTRLLSLRNKTPRPCQQILPNCFRRERYMIGLCLTALSAQIGYIPCHVCPGT